MTRFPFIFLYMKRKETSLGTHSKAKTQEPQGIIASNWALWHGDTSLALELLPPLPFWLRPLRKWGGGSPHLTIFVPHAVEALLNSHHAHHFSVSLLTSYGGLLLTAPHITLLHCNDLNLATLLPSPAITVAETKPLTTSYCWPIMIIFRKFLWVTLTSRGSLVLLI